MKIGHYMEGIWSPGGVSSYIRRISRAQRNSGHQVKFYDVLPAAETTEAEWWPARVANAHDLYRQALDDGLDLLHLHLVVDAPPPQGLPVIRTLHGHQAYCPSGAQYRARQAQPCGTVFSLGGCLKGHIVDHCGSVRPAKMLQSFRRTLQERRVLPNVPVMTVSNFLRQRMIASGYPADRIRVLQLMAPDVPELPPPPADNVPRFLFLGRITPQKGVQWLLRAAAALRVPTVIDIAGAGYAESEMRSLSASLGLDATVNFHGWVNQTKVRELMAAAIAVVFPSLWHEPGGTVAFEAMAGGRAVIMSRVGGMPEVIEDSINGLLVEPGDVDGLAAQISLLAQDRGLAARLGRNGREIVNRRFTLEQHMVQLMSAYDDAIAAEQTAGPASAGT